MAVMAIWRNKAWEVSRDRVAALENLAFSYEQQADTNTDVEGTVQTNERGRVPFSVTFSTTLHSGAGIDVRNEIESWEALLTKAGILYLNGRPLGPRTQLRKIDVSGVRLDDYGRMRYAVITFQLNEYDTETTSVIDVTSSSYDLSAEQKSALAVPNTSVIRAQTVSFGTGQYVRIIGDYFATGEKVQAEQKSRSYQIIKIEGERAMLGGILQWAHFSDLSMV